MTKGFVYFIACADKVKIGYSEDPVRRLTKINADSPSPCSMLGYVSATDFPESEIHERFASVRVHSEWFALTQEIRSFVDAVAIKGTSINLDKFERKDLAKATPLARWRYSQKLTQMEVADRLGVAQSLYNRWETGKRPVGAVHVLDVEELTGISANDLRPDIFRLPAKAERLAS